MDILRILTLALIAISVSAYARAELKSPQEWTHFRFSATNNSVLAGEMEASWHFATKSGFSSSPTIADGTLFIGNNAGQFYALDPRTGRVRWQYNGKNPFMSNPLVYGGVVIAGEGNQVSYHDPAEPKSERLLIGTGESAIVGLDEKTGELRWRVPTTGTAMPTGAIVHGMFVHHDGAGYVRAIDPRRGRVYYERSVRSVASMSAMMPLEDGSIVTTGTFPAAAIALKASRGTVLWKREFPFNASGMGDCPPASDGSKIYCNYFVPSNGGPRTELGQRVTQHVFALNARTGSLVWDVVTESGPLSPYNEASIPLLDRAMLFEGNSSAYLMNAIDCSTGKLRWRTHLLGTVKGGISAKNGTLYFGDSDGHLWALDEHTGRVIGVKDLGAQFNVGSPIIAGKTLIIGSRTGSIIAVPLSEIERSRDV